MAELVYYESPYEGQEIDSAIAWLLAHARDMLFGGVLTPGALTVPEHPTYWFAKDGTYTGAYSCEIDEGYMGIICYNGYQWSLTTYVTSADITRIAAVEEAVEELSNKVVGVIDISDIDDMNEADYQLATTPTRYAVKKVTSRGTVVVALLDILADDMRHVVTQVLTTHYVLYDGALDTSTHIDGELYQYYRSCKISGGTLPVDAGEWTDWQSLTPPMVTLTQESYDELADSGLTKQDTFYLTYE